MDHDGHIIRVSGAGTRLHLTQTAWCRARTTWPVESPDGVTRCVTVPNWQWTVWRAQPGPHPFDPTVLPRWSSALLYARYWGHDAHVVFAENLAIAMDRYHRRYPFDRTANDNPRPSVADRSRPLRTRTWRRGRLGRQFNAYAAGREPLRWGRGERGRHA